MLCKHKDFEKIVQGTSYVLSQSTWEKLSLVEEKLKISEEAEVVVDGKAIVEVCKPKGVQCFTKSNVYMARCVLYPLRYLSLLSLFSLF